MAPNESSSISFRGLGSSGVAEREAAGAMVWLHGEHDISTVASLSETMARAIALDDGDLVVDLSGVEFMGAATVGVIVRTREFLRARSRSLVLRAPTDGARRVLEACGLAELVQSAVPHATHPNGPAAALGTFVTVPTTDQLQPSDDRPAPAALGSVDAAGRVPATDPTTGEMGTS